jgi:serine/threonine-protein kinase
MSEASELVARESSSKIPAATSSPTPSSGGAPRSGTKKLGSSKFDLIAELGRGGMATVYLARAKRRPEKLLVLKQLRADLADNPEFLAMFLEEARLAGKLQHPNIVETYEVGEDAGTYYIAMEYLEGLSLQAVLTKFGWKGNFTFAMQVYVLIEVLKGLEHAYNQLDDEGKPLRIVHRDVSPPNIIITFDGKVKLVDFGIAKAANSNVETRTGLIKGKLTYMAPEQAQSGDVDARTDIYSVGVMLWQAAAGKRRWKGVENTEVLKRLHSGNVSDSPNAEQNGLPAIVNEIVLASIAADPECRYASASQLRAELEKLLALVEHRSSARELGRVMMAEFGAARARANDVLEARLRELSEPKIPKEDPATSEGETSIRPAKHRLTSSLPTGTASSGTSAKNFAEVDAGGRTQRTPVISATARTSLPKRGVLAMTLVGILVTAVVSLRFRMHSRAAEPPTSGAAPTMSSESVPARSEAPSLPATMTSPLAASLTTPVPADTAPATPKQQRRENAQRKSTPSSTPSVQAVEASPPMAPSATATVATPTLNSSAKPSSDHPQALDKQDPWAAPPAHGALDQGNPWPR